MPVIVLPGAPLPQSATPKPLDYGAWQEPIAGGTDTRLDRFGNRFSLDVVMPRMKPEPVGRVWVSRLVDAIGVDVQLRFPQVGLQTGNPGAPVVDGGGQGGNGIALRGFTPGYVIREGQFFNLVDANGRVYLYKARGFDLATDGNGNVVVPLPYGFFVRSSPADGSPANFAAPVIVGRLMGNENGWTLERAGTRGLEFTIRERS